MFLKQILASQKELLKRKELEEPLAFLQEKIDLLAEEKDFTLALSSKKPISLLAEVKKASPSKGILVKDFQPQKIAKTYAECGAAAISVLTEEKYFQGSLAYLEKIKQIVQVPLLRKDFLFSEYQIYQSKAYGADAVLLIAALLSKEELNNLLQLANKLGLACLVEVHDLWELEKVLSTPAKIIGINNRNLHTFTVDLERTFQLLPSIPPDKIIVSESGIRQKEDVEKLVQSGVQAILVGEALVTSEKIKEKVQELVGW